MYDSRFSPHADLHQLCRQEIKRTRQSGYESIQQSHVEQWEKLWDSSDLIIEGDEKAQIAIRFCLFHLLANIPHSDQVSISARGLQGQDYWGSIFWDCEIYVLPLLTYTQPDYARRSLMYRYHTLDGARRKAHELGYEGAYYAWQSQETGDETCALYVFDDPLTGEKIRSYFADEQIHISADVVYALWQHIRATDDVGFLTQSGLEIICEVARFFASRVTQKGGSYHLLTVLGPDEYHEQVDNNAYTNALAQQCLQIALEALKWIQTDNAAAYENLCAEIDLTTQEVDSWREIEQKLYIPVPDPETRLISQFDGYFTLEDAHPDEVRTRLKHPDQYSGGPTGPYQSTQSIKQADVVLLLYLLRDHYDQQTKKTNWQYYEPRTAHNSSLSPMAYALVAADVGMTEWAYRYFMQTALIDLLGTGPNWNLGVHTAAMGGAWLAIVHGFCQLDLRQDGIYLLNWPTLPAHWKRVGFNFYWHGLGVRFETDGDTTTLEVDSGTIPVIYPGGQITLEPGQAVQLQHKSHEEEYTNE